MRLASLPAGFRLAVPVGQEGPGGRSPLRGPEVSAGRVGGASRALGGSRALGTAVTLGAPVRPRPRAPPTPSPRRTPCPLLAPPTAARFSRRALACPGPRPSHAGLQRRAVGVARGVCTATLTGPVGPLWWPPFCPRCVASGFQGLSPGSQIFVSLLRGLYSSSETFSFASWFCAFNIHIHTYF